MHASRVLAALSLALLLTGLLTSAPAHAAGRCYIDADRTSGLNNGLSWENAYTDLQSPLGNPYCIEFWVAEGTYPPTTTSNRFFTFTLRNGVRIYGGFLGTETALSQRNPIAHPTSLTGSIGGGARAYHVVDASSTGRTTVLDGFAITAGLADWAGSVDYGAGMVIFDGSPTLRNLVFTQNEAAGFGGGIYSYNSSPSITNVIFDGNDGQVGGGLSSFTGSPVLRNVTFVNNTAGSYGGGLYTAQGSPILTNVTFTGNTAADYGGALYNAQFSSMKLVNATILGNTATAGGAVYNFNNASLTIKNSILYADNGGEIFTDGTSTTTVSFSIVQMPNPMVVFPGAGNLSANPMLLALDRWGGFTPTMPLGPGSPALDKGTNTGCPARDARGILRPQDGDFNGTARCDMGATEGRSIRKTYKSTGSQDGWVLETSDGSYVGGSLNAGASTLRVGDDAENRQYRSVLSFNTANLPQTGVIVSAVLKLRLQGVTGESFFHAFPAILLVEANGSHIGPTTALTVEDFGVSMPWPVEYTSPSVTPGGWYSIDLAPVIDHINLYGLTQYRLRFVLDDDNDMTADYLRLYSGNADSANRPKLLIKAFLP